MEEQVLSFQVKQAITSGVATLVAVAAIWGFDLSALNNPVVQGLILAAVSALASFLVKGPAKSKPSLEEAYHVVQSAEQAREHERWRAASAGPAGLRDDDGFRRPEPDPKP